MAQQNARALANQILALTQAIKLTGQPDLAEAEVEAFADLMDKREPLMDEMVALIRKSDPKDDAVQATIKEIVALDKRHHEIMEHIQNHLRTSIKGIKSGQRLNNVYTHPMENEYVGLLDAKK